MKPSPTAFLSVKRSLLFLGAAVLATATVRGEIVTWGDGAFSSGWLFAKVLDTTPGANATYTTQVVNGGLFHEDCQQTTHTWSNGAIGVAHYSSFHWTPADAPVAKLGFWFDLRHFTGTTVGGAVRVRPMVFQNGTTYHHATGTDVFDDQWSSII